MRLFFLGIVFTLVTLFGLAEWVLFPGRIPLKTDLETCPFCNETVLHNQQFLENKHVRALINYRPLCPGACLIVPKRHVTRFEELSSEEAASLFSMIQRVQKIVCNVYGFDDYSLVQKNGKNAFQTVGHIHFHLYPGFTKSPLKLAYHILRAQIAPPLSPEKMQKQIQHLGSYG